MSTPESQVQSLLQRWGAAPPATPKSSHTTGDPKLDKYYDDAAAESGVPRDLLLEQGRVESVNFAPDVISGKRDSPKGARGVSQFMADTARHYGLKVDGTTDERADPEKAIHAQGRLMAYLSKRHGGDQDAMLAAYNSGTGLDTKSALRNAQRIPETRDYVAKIRKAIADSPTSSGPSSAVQGLLNKWGADSPSGDAPDDTDAQPLRPTTIAHYQKTGQQGVLNKYTPDASAEPVTATPAPTTPEVKALLDRWGGTAQEPQTMPPVASPTPQAPAPQEPVPQVAPQLDASQTRPRLAPPTPEEMRAEMDIDAAGNTIAEQGQPDIEGLRGQVAYQKKLAQYQAQVRQNRLRQIRQARQQAMNPTSQEAARTSPRNAPVQAAARTNAALTPISAHTPPLPLSPEGASAAGDVRALLQGGTAGLAQRQQDQQLTQMRQDYIKQTALSMGKTMDEATPSGLATRLGQAFDYQLEDERRKQRGQMTQGQQEEFNSVPSRVDRFLTDLEGGPDSATGIVRRGLTSGVQSGTAGINSSIANVLGGFGLGKTVMPDTPGLGDYVRGLAQEGYEDAQTRTSADMKSHPILSSIAQGTGSAVPTMISYGVFKNAISAAFGPEAATPQAILTSMSVIENADKPVRDQIVSALFAYGGGKVFKGVEPFGRVPTMGALGVYGGAEGALRSGLQDWMAGIKVDKARLKTMGIAGAVNMGALGLMSGLEGEKDTSIPSDYANAERTPERPRLASLAAKEQEINATPESDSGISSRLGTSEPVNPAAAVDIAAVRRANPAPPDEGPAGDMFHHRNWGLVREIPDQTGVPKGKIRVVDADGKLHDMQKPNGRGEGNNLAVPVKAPEAVPEPQAEPVATQEPQPEPQAAPVAESQPEVKQAQEPAPVEPTPEPKPNPARPQLKSLAKPKTEAETVQPAPRSEARTWRVGDKTFTVTDEKSQRVGHVRVEHDGRIYELPRKALDKAEASGKFTFPPVDTIRALEGQENVMTRTKATLADYDQGPAVEPADMRPVKSEAQIAAEKAAKAGEAKPREVKPKEPEVVPPTTAELKAAMDKAAEEHGESSPEHRVALREYDKALDAEKATAEMQKKTAATQRKWDKLAGDWIDDKPESEASITKAVAQAKERGLNPNHFEDAQHLQRVLDEMDSGDRPATVAIANDAKTPEGHTTVQVGDHTADIPNEALGEIGDVKDATPEDGTVSAKEPAREGLGEAIPDGKVSEPSTEPAGKEPAPAAQEVKEPAEAPARPRLKSVKPKEGGFLENALPKEELDVVAQAKARLARSIKQRMSGEKATTGLTDEEFSDLVTIAKAYIKAGAKNAVDLGKRMAQDVGDWIAPHVQDVWDAIHAAKEPEAEAKPKAETTGIRRSVVEAERAARGDAPLSKINRKIKDQMRKSNPRLWQEADQAFKDNPLVGQQLVHELASEPRVLTDRDAAILTRERVQRVVEFNQANEALVKAAKGTPEYRAAMIELDRTRQNLNFMEEHVDLSKSETGRGLNALKLLTSLDYSLDAMEMRRRAAAKAGDYTVTQADYDQIRKEAEDIEQKRQEAETANQKLERHVTDLERETLVRQIADELHETYKQEVKAARAGKKRGEAIVDFVQARMDAAQKRMDARRGRFGAGQDLLLDIADQAIILAGKLMKGAVDFTNWGDEMIRDLTDKVEPHLPVIRRKAEALKKEWTLQFADKEKLTPEQAILKSEKRAEKFEKDTGAPPEGLDGKLIYDLVKTHMADILAEKTLRKGLDQSDEAFRRTHESLREKYPNATIDDIKTEFSDYGRVKFPSKVLLDRKVREARAIAQKQMQLNDVLAGRAAKKTGTQRDEATQAVRNLTKQLEAEMRKQGIAYTDEGHLKTASEKKATALINQMKDMNEQLEYFRETGKVPETLKHLTPEWNAQIKELIRVRDDLRKERDALIPELANKGRQALTVVQKQRNKLKSLIRRKEFLESGAEAPAKTGVPDTTEIVKIRDEVNALLEDTQEMRRSKARQDAIQRNLEKITDKIDSGDFTRTPPRPPAELTAQARKAQAALEYQKQRFEQENERIRRMGRSNTEKALDVAVYLNREFLLSSPTTVVTLGAAAVETAGLTHLEEGIGHGYSKLFPRVAKRSGVESTHGLPTSVVAAHEAKAVAEGFRRLFTDVGDKLTTGKLDFEKIYGPNKMPEEIVSFMGRIHGSLKVLPMREAFERAQLRLNEKYIREGIDVYSPEVQMQIGTKAFLKAQEAVFLNSNAVTDAYQTLIAVLSRPKAGTEQTTVPRAIIRAAIKLEMPIVRVPTNIVSRTGRAIFGVVTGGLGMGNAYGRNLLSKHPEAVKLLGSLGEKYARAIDEMPEEQADLIFKRLKQGTPGAAMTLLGFFAANSFSGFYQQGDDPKLKGDIPEGGARVFGINIPRWAMHIPVFQGAQFGATVRKVWDKYEASTPPEERSKWKGVGKAVYAAAMGLIEETPFMDEINNISSMTPGHDTGKTERLIGETAAKAIPAVVKWGASRTDVDSGGIRLDPRHWGENEIPRKPSTVTDYLKQSVPHFREQVPEKYIPERRQRAIETGDTKEVERLQPLIQADMERKAAKKSRETGMPVNVILAGLRDAETNKQEKYKEFNAKLRSDQTVPLDSMTPKDMVDKLKQGGIQQAVEIYKDLPEKDRDEAEAAILTKAHDRLLDGKLTDDERKALTDAGFDIPAKPDPDELERKGDSKEKREEGSADSLEKKRDKLLDQGYKPPRRRLKSLGVTAPAM